VVMCKKSLSPESLPTFVNLIASIIHPLKEKQPSGVESGVLFNTLTTIKCEL
jgi:hypothetical protein